MNKFGLKIQNFIVGCEKFALKLGEFYSSRGVKFNQILVCIFLLFFVLTLELHTNFHYTPFGTRIYLGVDSSVFSYIGQAILRGEMPYRDIFDHKGPLLYLINALGNAIAPLRGTWFVEFAGMLVAAGFAYKTARLFLGRLWAVFAVVFGFYSFIYFNEGANLTETHALPFIFAALYFFARYFARGGVAFGKAPAFIVGFTLGAVFLLRPNIIALWVVFCVYVAWREARGGKFEFVAFCLAGFCAIVLPICAWLGVGGAFGEFINQYFVFNFEYTNFNYKSRDTLKLFCEKLSDFPMLASLAAIAIFACIKRDKFSFAFLVFAVLNVKFATMSGRPFGHYFVPLLLNYFYGGVCLARLASSVLAKYLKTPNVFAVLVVVGIIFITPPPAKNPLIYNFDFARKMIMNNKFMPQPQIEEAERARIAKIRANSATDEKIIVIGNAVRLYFAANRTSATKYIYQQPPLNIDKARKAEFFDEVRSKKPRVIVDAKISAKNKTPHTYIKELADWMRENGYKDVGDGVWVLGRR